MPAHKKISSNKYFIDQSGKIEQTNKDTIVAISNGFQATILLKKQDKRKLQAVFKKLEEGKHFPYFVFSALLALLLKEYLPKTKVQIDNEYLGYENFIIERGISYLKQLGVKSYPKLEIGHIGKGASAHILALRVAHKKEKPDKVATFKEVLDLVFGAIKNDREFQLKPQDRLTQDWLPGGRRSSRSIKRRYHKTKKKSRKK